MIESNSSQSCGCGSLSLSLSDLIFNSVNFWTVRCHNGAVILCSNLDTYLKGIGHAGQHI